MIRRLYQLQGTEVHTSERVSLRAWRGVSMGVGLVGGVWYCLMLLTESRKAEMMSGKTPVLLELTAVSLYQDMRYIPCSDLGGIL